MTSGFRWQKVVVGFGAGLAVLVTLEAGLRLQYPHRAEPVSHYLRRDLHPHYQRDDRLLVTLRPGRHGHWMASDTGLRGAAGPTDATRILVYGDGNILAPDTPETATFTQQLALELQQQGHRGIAVLNAGLEGAGPDQALQRLSDDIARFQPRLVILHVFADNDFGDVVRNRLYNLDSRDKLVPTGLPVNDALHLGRHIDIPGFVQSLVLFQALERLWQHASQFMANDKAVATVSRPPALQRLLLRLQAEMAVYRNNQPATYGHFDDPYDLDLAALPLGEDAQLKLRLMNSVLKNFRQETRAAGVNFMLTIEPSAHDIGIHPLLNAAAREQFPAYHPRNLVNAFEQLALLNDIPYVNLYGLFIENDARTLYDHQHRWNTQGQALAATATATTIHQHHLLDKAAR